MAESMFSPFWYRVAGLRPRLKGSVRIHRHYYRDQLWYVLQDASTGLNHRFSPQVHHIISLLDGVRSLQDVWELSLSRLSDDAPTQDELVNLLGQLHGGDLLICDVPPDIVELFQRQDKKRRSQWLQRLLSPLSLRIPLWNPDAFLNRNLPKVEPFFGWFGAILWLLTVGTAAVMAASHWPDLSRNVSDQVLAPSNLVILFLVYPLVKLLHELGHAFATKAWGGDVHEMGVMLLVFMPIPYVDASSAWGFRDKKQRMVVGAAGMIVELFLAALALFIWLNVQPGVVRSIAYNVVLIGGVSTLFFNGNPLLRFDGYYIFADGLEIPNLAARANNYLGYLAQRYLFGIQTAISPVTAASEKLWFIVYGIASAVYRWIVTFSIILFVAGKFFVIGVILAIWGGATMIALPLHKALRFVFVASRQRHKQARTVLVSALLALLVFGLVGVLPMPLDTYAEGVIWLPEQAIVRAKTEGFVRQVLVKPNTWVEQGDLLLVMEDPILLARQQILSHQLQELEVQYNDAWMDGDRVKAQVHADQASAVQTELAQVNQKIEWLSVRSAGRGYFILPSADDLPDRFLKQGELAGYVVEYPITTVRGVVTQDDIGLVRARTKSVEVRLAEQVAALYSARILREVPAASDQLPSSALGLTGGGVIPVKSEGGKEGATAFEPVFHLELAIPESVDPRHIGERVYIRFDHGAEPLLTQWYRLARQLFLRRFSV